MKENSYGKKSSMSKKAKKMTGYIIGIGILTAMIVFFSYYKVDSVEVRGTSHYTDEEVKAMVLRGPLASNSVLAPMLYSTTNTDDVAFVDAFKVTQLNRNTICISVKEKKPVGCIHYLDSYIYFDRNGIFVEGSKTRDESVPYFDGIQVNKVVMDEKLDIKGETVLNTAVALSTIFQKNDKIPDHIQFGSSYSISLIYGDVTVQLGKDENLEEKMNRVLAILPNLTGKKGILHIESVSSDMNTFEEEQEEVEITAENWNGGYDENGDYTGDGEYDENGNYVGAKPMTALEEAKNLAKKFDDAMDDDFNTADAISVVFELVRLANSNVNEDGTKAFVQSLLDELLELGDILGLVFETKEEILDEEIEKLIEERQVARKERNFQRADEIRAELLEKGIVLEDTREGVKWKRA